MNIFVVFTKDFIVFYLKSMVYPLHILAKVPNFGEGFWWYDHSEFNLLSVLPICGLFRAF
ncbi:MAG: hypothetical protein Q4C98_08090 [Capnocytophaga sp.]|nr:hypothetical protein [Capnocytophaga sp.]